MASIFGRKTVQEDVSVTLEQGFEAQKEELLSIVAPLVGVLERLESENKAYREEVVSLKSLVHAQEGTLLTIYDEVVLAKKYARSTRREVKKGTPDNSLQSYVSKDVDNLDNEKAASEIISTLYDKLTNPHGRMLRSFYTELEREVRKPIGKLHKERLASVKGDISKYPHRKMDTVIMHIDRNFVLDFAKRYKFKTA